MSKNPTMKPGLVRPSLNNRVVLFVPRGETALAVWQRRRSDTLLARLRSRKLDAQLAAGRPPESGRLLAVRAAMLVTPASRDLIAMCWEDLVVTARYPVRPMDPRVPLATAQIAAADDAISALVAALRAPRPVAARGVAEAAMLLGDGRGPVYNDRSSGSLAAAALSARSHLETVMMQMA